MLNTIRKWLAPGGQGEVRSAVWDAAGNGNRLANWTPQVTSPNMAWDNPVWLRGRAETEYRNNPWARRVVDSLVNAAIGAPGLNPMFADKSVAAEWGAWCDSCDAAGRLDWVAIEQLVLRTVAVSGECFVRLVVNETARVPLGLQVLGPEFLDTSRTDRNTYAGIRYDGIRRAGYWLWPQNPLFAVAQQSVFVPASEVLHVYRPHTPGAERGVSWLAPVLLALKELGEYSEAALVRAKVAALYCGYIQTNDGTNPLKPTNEVPTMEPGSMIRLQGGEIVEFSEPPDVGISFDPFVRSQLRKIAAGASIPYEILSGDLSAVTFASGRHGLLEWRRHTESVQHVLMVPQFGAPVLARWMRLAAALGVIDGPVKARWIGPRIGMLDEKSETAATVQKIRAGLLPRAEAVAMDGWDIETIDAEIAADNARADRYGNVYDSDPRKTTNQGQEQQSASSAQEN